MRIVTDSAMDMTPEQRHGLDNIHAIPLLLTLDGKSYRSGVDIQPKAFYELLSSTSSFPSTSQPSPGDFAELYKSVAAQDPEILSVHVSSGLSGTLNAAKLGATMLHDESPGVHISHYDTKTLSGAEGWHVEAAARAAKAGWSKAQIIPMLERISSAANLMFTVATLKYLVHGGRVSNLRGLVGSILDIKPIIGVEKADGKYGQRATARSLSKAVMMMADLIAKEYAPGTPLRVQVLHGHNEADAKRLMDKLNELYPITWVASGYIDPSLGAHTGAGLVGVVYAPAEVFAEVP